MIQRLLNWLIIDVRRIPAIVYLLLTIPVVAACVFLLVALNLNDQAEGLLHWNRSLGESATIWFIGTHSHALVQSGAVDTMMPSFEGAWIFFGYIVMILERDVLYALNTLGLPENHAKVLQKQWQITFFSSMEGAFKWGFFGAAGLSVFLVGTHYVTQVQGHGIPYYFNCFFALATGLATPGLIFFGMFVWGKMVQGFLVLLTAPRGVVADEDEAPVKASSADAAIDVRSATAPVKKQKADPVSAGHGVPVPPTRAGKVAVA